MKSEFATHALAVSPDGREFAVAEPRPWYFTTGGGVVTRRRLDGGAIGESSRMDGRIITLAYAADGRSIGAIDNSYTVRVWRAEGFAESLSSDLHKCFGRRYESAETRANFSADLRRAVIVNDDDNANLPDATWNHVVRLWEAGSNEPRILGGRGGQATCCALVSPDGSQIVTALQDYFVFFTDFATRKGLHGFSPGNVRRGDDYAFMMLSPDNRRIVLATKSGGVLLNNLDDKLNGSHGFSGPYGYVRAATFTPKGVRFASGGWNPLGAETIPGTDRPKYEPVILWEVEVEK